MHSIFARVILALALVGAAAEATGSDDNGRAVYRFYCYQCHGYSGDADTLASGYLAPEPRNFTAHDDQTLPRERMLDAVTNGRPGTAMVSFSNVLSENEIADVVDYVRRSFMQDEPLAERYHSPENGWPDHERYASAFPYVQGGASLDTPWEELNASAREGRRLYETACVTCHDQPNAREDELTFELRAVSYPRDHFTHKSDAADFVSAASPYARHDVPVRPEGMTPAEERGMQLYLQNCEFCHAADGTGRNWIGSFLEPRPRDFTSPDFALMKTPGPLRELIRGGIENTSMPAWRHVLTDDEIDDIIRYMQAAFAAE